MAARTTNLIVNLNKIRAANVTARPESAVFVFDYYAQTSNEGEERQRPLVRVVKDSLHKSKDGNWVFSGVNLYRINNKGGGGDSAVRTFRLDRINGVIHRP